MRRVHFDLLIDPNETPGCIVGICTHAVHRSRASGQLAGCDEAHDGSGARSAGSEQGSRGGRGRPANQARWSARDRRRALSLEGVTAGRSR